METNEGFKDWFRKFGDAALNWSPVNKDTMNTYPSQYAPPTQPIAAQRKLPQQVQAPAKQKTVGFNISDMQNLKSVISDYLGMITRYLNVIHRQVPYPDYVRRIINSFEKHVGPAYQDLGKKVQWIDQMNTLARSQYEWEADEAALFLESVRINYKRFEEMVKAFQTLAMTFKRWVYAMVERLPEGQGSRLRAIYDQNILRQQAFVGKQVQWLQQKLAQLMQANNIPYRQV